MRARLSTLALIPAAGLLAVSAFAGTTAAVSAGASLNGNDRGVSTSADGPDNDPAVEARAGQVWRPR